MRPVVHLVTRDYPFGTGEAFVADEAARLRRVATVVVVPAFATPGDRRELPGEVTLDDSLARRPLLAMGGMRWGASILRAAIPDLGRRPDWPMRPGAIRAMAGYAIRGARAAEWARGLLRRQATPPRILSTWSNAEAFGLALAARRDPRLRLVCRAHGFDVDERVYPGGHLPFRDTIAQGSLALGPISEAGATLLRARHPGLAERIVVARLGVDPPSGCERLHASVVDAGPRTIATCSRDHPVKRLDLVADAIAAAAATDPSRPWTWLHLGGGGDRLRRRLGGHASPPTLIAPGEVPRARIFKLYAEHRPRVFVNLSSSEGVPVTIMEALAMGIPVVATNAGGTGELVDDAVGRLLPIEIDASAAGRAIVEVAAAADDLRESAVRRWRARASDAAVAEMLARLVEPLLDAESSDRGE